MTRNQLRKTQDFKNRVHDKWAEAGGTASRVSRKTIEKYVLDELTEELGQHQYLKG